MKDLSARLREVFAAESAGDLAALRDVFGKLHAAEPASSPAEFSAVYQLAHKVKGACRAVGFQAGQALGYHLEYLFRALHAKPAPLPAELHLDATATLRALEDAVKSFLAGEEFQMDSVLGDRMDQWIEEANRGLSNPDHEPAEPAPVADAPAFDALRQSSQSKKSHGAVGERLMQSFRAEAAEILEVLHAAVSRLADSAEARDGRPADLTDALRAAHTLKGAAHVVRIEAVPALAHELEDVFRDAEKEHGISKEETAAQSRRLLNLIESALQASGGLAATSDTALPDPVQSASTTAQKGFYRIEKSRIASLEESYSEILAVFPHFETLCEDTSRLSADFSMMAREEETLRRNLGALLYRAPENQEYARAASYVNFTSRQVRLLQRSITRIESGMRKIAAQLETRLDLLEEGMHGLRVTRAEEVLAGLRLMASELSERLQKPVELQTDGFDLEMEMPVLQSLRGALIHMLRNALDHGIETAPERLSAGKPPSARIRISLSLEGGHYCLRVADDGRGLPEREIRRSAIRAGLCTEDEAARLSGPALTRLIFHPRLSTAREVTDVSGRGIGLSSVIETIRALDGTVECESNPGKGTVFIIRIPAARVGSRALLVRAADAVFGIPSRFVEKVTRISEAEIETNEKGSHWISPHGPVPLGGLAEMLGLPALESRGVQPVVVLLRTGETRHALVVDSLLGMRQVVVRDLSPVAAASGLFGGCIVIGEGEAGLLLDPNALLARKAAGAVRGGAPPRNDSLRASGEPCILVVDDSYTSRTLEAGVIESLGYRVVQAADGMDGLRALRNEKVDLILCDIEMPRLDGFGMLSEVKKQERLRDIPFILISSIEDPAIVQKGLALGADSYIVKRYFEQEELRSTIRHYL